MANRQSSEIRNLTSEISGFPMAITSQKQSNTTLVAHHAQISETTKNYVRNYQKIMQNKPNLSDAQMNVNIFITKDYNNFIPLAGYKNKPNLVRPALFAKELPDWSNPIRQACVVCEGVAGLIKRDLRLTPVPAFSVRAAQVRAGVLQNISAIRNRFVRISTSANNKVITGNWRYVL